MREHDIIVQDGVGLAGSAKRTQRSRFRRFVVFQKDCAVQIILGRTPVRPTIVNNPAWHAWLKLAPTKSSEPRSGIDLKGSKE